MKVIGLYKELMNYKLVNELFIDEYVMTEISVDDFDKGTMTPFDYSDYIEASRHFSHCHKPKYKKYYEDDTTEKVDIPATLKSKAIELQSIILIKKLNVYCDNQVSILSGTKYSDMERASWDKQETEARSYAVDNTTPTPFIDAIVAARNIDKNTLINKIIANANEYDTDVATIIGITQKNIADVNACNSIAEMAALELPVGLRIFNKLEPE